MPLFTDSASSKLCLPEKTTNTSSRKNKSSKPKKSTPSRKKSKDDLSKLLSTKCTVRPVEAEDSLSRCPSPKSPRRGHTRRQLSSAEKESRRVSFATVEIREYPLLIGTSESCSLAFTKDGPGLTIDWVPVSTCVQRLDEIEQQSSRARPSKTPAKKMKPLESGDRAMKLLRVGYTMEDLKQCMDHQETNRDEGKEPTKGRSTTVYSKVRKAAKKLTATTRNSPACIG